MNKKLVSILRYEKPFESVREAVDLADGLANLPRNARVFIKPNIVFWSTKSDFPKWGVITTSRVVEDTVVLLKEHGIEDITIGEGITLRDPIDTEIPSHAFAQLGYDRLTSRYGVKCLNIHERPFQRVEIGAGVALKFNSTVLQSDFLINLPVLKTHAQTVVSLGAKNLKGLLDIRSRKLCHCAGSQADLHSMVAGLPRLVPPSLTILDGIYTNARGPLFDGTARRSNLIVVSSDLLSADMVGSKLLGYEPSEVPHLTYLARASGRPLDLSDVEVVGESIEDLSFKHPWTFPYTDDDSLSIPLKRLGIQGLSFPKYDLSLCTYCSLLYGVLSNGIAQAWQDQPWDDIEVLTGKVMKPTAGKKKTVLIGKCMFAANKNNPNINEMLAVKGCPPSLDDAVRIFQRAGIPLDSELVKKSEKYPAIFMKKYEGIVEFEESFYTIA
jgi:uncharacterized protein (DUF362 family)